MERISTSEQAKRNRAYIKAHRPEQWKKMNPRLGKPQGRIPRCLCGKCPLCKRRAVGQARRNLSRFLRSQGITP